MQGTIQQQATGAAGRVIDAFAGLRVHDQGHQFDHGAVGIKLGGGMAAVVGKFLDQVFVGVAQLIIGHIA